MKQVFINLPVKDVEKSMHFYTQLGFMNKLLFTDDQQKCMVWSEQIYVMLMSHQKFKTYGRKAVPDSKNHITAYYTLPVENLDRVNEIMEIGLKAGGIEPIAMIDEGFMQIRRIEDYDGHIWDIVYMDISKFRKG